MQFTLLYDGEGLKNNEINLGDLSAALVGINQLLEETNKILNGNKQRIKVVVKAFKPGSFQIDFSVVQTLINQAIELFTSNGVLATKNALQIIIALFGITGSLYAFLRFLKGRKYTKRIETEDGSYIVYVGSESCKIGKEILKLYNNYKIRKAFEDAIKPIEKEGIEEFAVKIDKEKDYAIIKKGDYHYYKCIPKQEFPQGDPVVYNTSIRIINLSFEEKNKWYVNDGQSNFFANIEDNKFMKQINSNKEEFSKGSILEVRIRRQQFLDNSGKLKTEHFIETVIKHIKYQQQENLFEK